LGIFAWDGNAVVPVMMQGWEVEGRRVVDMLLSSHGLRDGMVAYSVLFEGGESALLVSPVPALPGGAVLLSAAAALGARRRRT
jgi:MYXO-CTERM domain-containing protein